MAECTSAQLLSVRWVSQGGRGDSGSQPDGEEPLLSSQFSTLVRRRVSLLRKADTSSGPLVARSWLDYGSGLSTSPFSVNRDASWGRY